MGTVPCPEPCKTPSHLQSHSCDPRPRQCCHHHGKTLFSPQNEGQRCSHPHFTSAQTFLRKIQCTRQRDVSVEHQGQKQIICHQIICHQTLVLQAGSRCPSTGVPSPGLTGDSSAPPQFLAEHGKSEPRAPRGALNPSHFASLQIQPLVPASVSPPGQRGRAGHTSGCTRE